MKKLVIFLSLLGMADVLFLLLSGACKLRILPLPSWLSFPGWVVCIVAIIWFSIAIVNEKLSEFIVKLWVFVGAVGILVLTICAFIVLKHYYCPYCYAAYVIGLATIVAVRRQRFANSLR
ncbi:MAG: hypothetical protein H0Z19_05905 [Archaeoglobus sp.]|uniref:hypothetical protein n=1 Tax=Archaeoglobus sp. TaxID=1872626 RepID=UPI001DF001B1|nr:hypothetical protein [Archaeoglobus sp.]MBO8180002.1 hypothetical protein [Archaeoglobus sp.]